MASTSRQRPTLLVFSQTFVPDPAAVGQQMTDVAIEMARRGWRVRVFTSARGYEDASIKYPSYEIFHGVEIRRLPLGSLGKRNLPVRVLGTFLFQLQCLLIGLFLPKIDGIFFSTSPPMVGIIATIVGLIRHVPTAYWAMDLNPDQLIALGKLKPRALTTRVLETINRFILRRSSLIVALDRFMAQRLLRRGEFEHKMLVMPPWPHDDYMEGADAGANPFRMRHGINDKFVIMYSGNHSPSNPLDTLLDAAVRLKDDPNIRFLFVGGGSSKKDVEAFVRTHHLSNALLLPYQPLSELKYSLSAADVHVVSLGADMVGIIHPCKIYGAMAVGRPILYFGPSPSHVTDLLGQHDIGKQVAHGDVEGAINAIEALRASGAQKLQCMGATAQAVLRQTLSQQALCARLCDRLEQVLLPQTCRPALAQPVAS